MSSDFYEQLEMALEDWQPDGDQFSERDLIEEHYLYSCEAAKDEARNIDPETAEVWWWYGDINYPYAGFRLHPYYGYSRGEMGRDVLYFARAPVFSPYGECARRRMDSYGWVWIGDLPESVRDALMKKHKAMFEADPPAKGDN